MRILVTGGCGFCGSVLVPKLLALGHQVVVVDVQWFGNYLEPHPALTVFKRDIRADIPQDPVDLGDIEAIIHLAGVANDPCGELNPKLSWEINALATAQLADQAARTGVKQFIYASSGSVYGVKGDRAVREDETLVPVSEYNKTKMVAERVLLSYMNRMRIQIVRPGTVCGYSPRQRLDVSVNGLTMQALTKGEIEVGGSDLRRANIHIEDMAGVYLFLLDNPTYEGVFNAAFENVTLGEIAAEVAKRVPCRITEVPVTDPRSYRINSERIVSLGFKPQRTICNAIDDLVAKFNAGQLKDEDRWYNIKQMRLALNLSLE